MGRVVTSPRESTSFVAPLPSAVGVIAGDEIPPAVDPIPLPSRLVAAPRAAPPRSPREPAVPRTAVADGPAFVVVILDATLAVLRRDTMLLVETREVLVAGAVTIAGAGRLTAAERRVEERMGAVGGRRTGIEAAATTTFVLGVGRGGPLQVLEVDFGVAARRSSTETSSSAGSRRQLALQRQIPEVTNRQRAP